MMDREHVCRGKLPQIRTLGISSFCDATPQDRVFQCQGYNLPRAKDSEREPSKIPSEEHLKMKGSLSVVMIISNSKEKARTKKCQIKET